MIKAIIMYLGKRTKTVQVQLLCATLYGLVSLYGVGGAVAIVFKARKLTKTRKAVKK